MGLFTPAVFSGISTSYFTSVLGMLMLSMGITLTVDTRGGAAARYSGYPAP